MNDTMLKFMVYNTFQTSAQIKTALVVHCKEYYKI